jgi:phosphoribosylglycinamide formyltransferase-1
MPTQRVAVLVSGGGTNLQKILEAQQNGRLTSGRVELVLSSKPGVFALERANRAGVPAFVANRGALTQADFEEALLKKLAAFGTDVIVLAGFLRILSPGFVARYPGRIINIHPALLPAFCGEGFYGLRVHRAALARGVKLTGATAHLVNEVSDGGPILLQKAVAVLPGDTPETLQRRVMEEAEWEILPQAVELLCKQLATSPKN